jgi:hypothetical protein
VGRFRQWHGSAPGISRLAPRNDNGLSSYVYTQIAIAQPTPNAKHLQTGDSKIWQGGCLVKYQDVLMDILSGNDPEGRQNFQIALDAMKQMPDHKALLEIELTDEQAGAIRQELQRQRAGKREWFFTINDKAFLRRFGVDVPE